MGFPGAQMVKNPPAVREIWVWSRAGKILWRRAWQPTPVFLPGESPWTEEPGGLWSMGSQRAGHDWATKHSTAQPVAPREASPPSHREVEVSPPPESRLSLWLVLIHKYSRSDAGSGEICRLCSGKLATLPLGPSHHAVTSPGRGEDDVVRWASLWWFMCQLDQATECPDCCSLFWVFLWDCF